LKTLVSTPLGDAYIEGGQWFCEHDKVLEKLLNELEDMNKNSLKPYAPDEDIRSAFLMVEELGGQITEYPEPEPVKEGVVY